MRGRLINPFLAELRILDTTATAADPDGAGPLTSGYDEVFREPVLEGTGAGTVRRVEKAAIRVPCQIENGDNEKMQMFFSGNSPDSRIVLVFHFRDLERMGLVEPTTGQPKLREQMRLQAIYNMRGVLVQTIETPVYAVQVQPTSFGLGGARNLCVIYFESRETAPAS